MKQFIALFALLLCAYALAQDERRVELDKDAIEAITAAVSPGCRSEIEAAIETGTGVGDECQVEIQSAIETLNIRPGEGSAGKSSGDTMTEEEMHAKANQDRADRRRRRQKAKEEREAKEERAKPFIHPIVTTGAYIVLIVGGIWAYFKYNSLPTGEVEDESDKKKKGGKKKN